MKNTKAENPKLAISLKIAKILVIIVIFTHIIHGLTLDRIVQYKEVSFHSPRIPAEIDGYRVAFISDTHRNSDRRFERIVERLNDLQIDLLILGGDYAPTNRMKRVMEILSQVSTTDGIFGVEGNHDNYRILFAAMRANNITPLSNNGVHIRENFFLAGLEDLLNRNADIAQATADAASDDFVLLITHHPDVTMRQDTTNIDLILAGHTHGGQMTFFGLWGPATNFVSRYGQRFMTGWAESRDGTPVYVSNGVGEYMPRIFARPQVIIVTLVHDSGD